MGCVTSTMGRASSLCAGVVPSRTPQKAAVTTLASPENRGGMRQLRRMRAFLVRARGTAPRAAARDSRSRKRWHESGRGNGHEDRRQGATSEASIRRVERWSGGSLACDGRSSHGEERRAGLGARQCDRGGACGLPALRAHDPRPERRRRGDQRRRVSRVVVWRDGDAATRRSPSSRVARRDGRCRRATARRMRARPRRCDRPPRLRSPSSGLRGGPFAGARGRV